MENRSLEAGLSQKLMMLENAAACVASAKAHLRANSEAVRKDISESISQQLSLIRAREQELLMQLDWAVARKETALSEQQQQLHKGIGSCQQALESVRKSGDGQSNATEVLSRLSHLDMNPQEGGGRIEFEKDSMKLRSTLSSFGTIRSVPGRHGAPKTGDSLPFEMEDYEDDVGMCHKSVLRLGSAPAGSHTAAHAETVQQWLKKIPSGPVALDTDMSALMAQFEVVKASSPAPQTDISHTSSFEVMHPEEHAMSHVVLGQDFVHMLSRPLADWLLQSAGHPMNCDKAEGKEEKATGEGRCMKRRHSMDNPVSAKKYEFERVIRDVQNSNVASWQIRKVQPAATDCSEPEVCSSSHCAGPSSTFHVAPPCSTEQKPVLSPSSFDEKLFISHLASLFAIPSSSKTEASSPATSRSDSIVSIQNLHNFKAALDKAHVAASWLLEKHQ